MVTLTIQPPGSAPVTHVLKDETITIGRMSGNTLVINDSSVSLVHAKITRKNGEFVLKDLNSTNGTTVNGQRVGEATLHHRDAVRFADVGGQFNDEPNAAEAVAVSPSAARAAPAPPAIAPLRAAASASAPPSSVSRRWSVTLLSAACGTVAAMVVLSVLGWNLLRRSKTQSETAPSAPGLVAKTPSSTAPAVRNAPAAEGPGTEAAAPDLPQLIKTLQDPDPAARRQAVAALHSMGPDAASATPALHQALSDPDQEVRLWAALTLINDKSYDKAIPPILLHELHDEKPMLRQLACVSLGLLPYEPAEKQTVVPALVAAAHEDADEDVRKAAASALGVIDPEGTSAGTNK